jgi:hypothetical protein
LIAWFFSLNAGFFSLNAEFCVLFAFSHFSFSDVGTVLLLYYHLSTFHTQVKNDPGIRQDSREEGDLVVVPLGIRQDSREEEDSWGIRQDSREEGQREPLLKLHQPLLKLYL